MISRGNRMDRVRSGKKLHGNRILHEAKPSTCAVQPTKRPI